MAIASGVCGPRGALVARMAELMLRAMGATEARIVRLAAVTGTEQERQLGIAPPQYREAVISPATFQPVDSPTRAMRVSVLLPASVVLKKAEEDGEENGAAWLLQSRGIEYEGVTLRITGVKTELFAGVPYLYRLKAEE